MLRSALSIGIVLILIVSLYICVISGSIYLLSFIDVLEISIQSTDELLLLSFFLFLGLIPVEFTSILFDAIFRDRLIIREIQVVAIVAVFTLYFHFVQVRFADIMFSMQGEVTCIIVLLVYGALTHHFGKKLEASDKD